MCETAVPGEIGCAVVRSEQNLLTTAAGRRKMNKRTALCIDGILCLLFLGLGVYGFVVLGGDHSSHPSYVHQRLIGLTSMTFCCSGLVGILVVAAVALENSRWFKNKFGELKNRKGKTAAKRKCLNVVRILCLSLFVLGIPPLMLLATGGLRQRLHLLFFLMSETFLCSGLFGFLAAFMISFTKCKWLKSKSGDFENMKGCVTVKQKYLNVTLIAVGILSPLLWFLCLKIVTFHGSGMMVPPWLGILYFGFIVFYFFAAGPIGGAAVLTVFLLNRKHFRGRTAWLGIGLLLLLLLVLLINIPTVFPLSLPTIEALPIHIK